jgi:hypothetical protein
MRSSEDRFWKKAEGWQSRKSHIRLRVSDSLHVEEFDAEVMSCSREESKLDLRRWGTGEELNLDLKGADIRTGPLALPVNRASNLEELELGDSFAMMWEGDNETRLTISEIRDFGKPV